jgi:hypothetical protein
MELFDDLKVPTGLSALLAIDRVWMLGDLEDDEAAGMLGPAGIRPATDITVNGEEEGE